MKLIRKANEDEMILEFLKGELNSKRFKELIMPMQETLEKILREINVKKFENL